MPHTNPNPGDRFPNEWYDLEPRYCGHATIVFDGEQPIEGTGYYSTTACGDGKIDFESQDTEHSQRLTSIFQGAHPGVVLPNGPPQPSSLLIATDGGTYEADYKVYITRHTSTFGCGSNSTAELRAIGSEFFVADAEAPAHFILPLYNMLSPSFSGLPRPQTPEIENHQLRIFPTPLAAIDATGDDELLNRNWHNRLVTFQIDGQIGFIEPLPDYQIRRDRLRGGTEKSLITAVLVCNAANRDCQDDDPTTWFPIEILNLLSLATGQRVGAPWIEYRDWQGRLVRRVHRHFGCPSFNPGHPILTEEEEPNTGYIVTQGIQYPGLSSTNSRLIINHLINAGIHRRSIDERLISLIRAFEVITVEEGVAKTDLLRFLDPKTAGVVQAELVKCQTNLRAIGKSVMEPDRSVIGRITDRVLSAGQQDVVFGLAVGKAISGLGFHDTDVLNGFVATTGESWPGLLSRLRGAVIHQGGLDLLGGGYDIQEIARIASHLHDVLVRIVCRRLGSSADYSSPLFPVGRLRKLDWIRPTTPIEHVIPS